MSPTVGILCLIFGFVAGYILHGWELDGELDALRRRIEAALKSTVPERGCKKNGKKGQ